MVSNPVERASNTFPGASSGHAKTLRVLHLFSNCKWTGPAEPALNLCVALRARGIEADFACAPDAGSSINKVVETARDRGIEPILRFSLSKHTHLLKDFWDKRALSALLREKPYDLVHCHLDNDHAIAAKAAQHAGIPLVRSNYHGEGLPETRRLQRLVAGTAFLIEPSQRALEHDSGHFSFSRERMDVCPGAVDIERFDPRRDTPSGRRWLNIPPDALVFGIVARMQTHRHYEDLFEAFRRLTESVPEAHLIVVGRGTKQTQVGFRPVAELGLQNRVHFPGFIDGENYVGMLRAFDAGVFLVPGSDGTCRAAREILAMGKPMIVADRGMLREIVRDGETGYVCSGSADSLYAAFLRVAQDRVKRREMGAAARRQAESEYSLEVQAARVEAIYRKVLA